MAEERYAEYKEAFTLFDSDGDGEGCATATAKAPMRGAAPLALPGFNGPAILHAGFITTKELGTVLRALGKSPTEAEIRQIVKDIDPDNRGVVDYKEFEKIMTRDIRAYDNEQDLKSAWKVRANSPTPLVTCTFLYSSVFTSPA